MGAFVSKNRWAVLAAGVVIQIFTGVPSAWGVFQKAVCEEFGFSEQGGCMVFACTIAAFGVGCILGGLLQDRAGPRVAGLTGAGLLAGGFALSALVSAGWGWLLFFSFSLPVGLGCAFLYPSVMSTAQKWYAGRKGLATGVIGGAVGLSGAALTFMGRGFMGLWGLRGAFLALGGLSGLFCAAACLLLVEPEQASSPAAAPAGQDYTVGQMLKTRQYYLILAAVALSTPSVLLFSPIIVQLGQQRGLDERTALLAIIIGSVGSAAGRLLMPLLSDKIGRRAADLILFAALAVLSAAFAFAGGWLVIAAYTALTFCYSGQAAIIPALGTDLYGYKNAGVNYGFLALGMSVGSVLFSLLANNFDGAGARHWVAVAASAAGFVALLFLKPLPGQKKKKL